jgi:dGTPase
LSIDQGRKAKGQIALKSGFASSREDSPLAPYAVDFRSSRGRLVPEEPSPSRSPFARDRDRILHASAFRRLTHKTQVFIYHEGDHYRTRLTHSLEVAQIARSIARTLRLDEDLTEALALAHDLGHPPFGHSGERALACSMADAGGFDHNAQSLRVVTALEKKYAKFDGLNLTWETLEGLVKHNGPLRGPNIPEAITDYCAKHDLELETYASLEAQVASLADDIAYNNHDIDDGYRAGCFSFEELAEIRLAARSLATVRTTYPGIEGSRLLYETNRRMITAMIEDAVAETKARLGSLRPQNAAEVRGANTAIAAFSETMTNELEALRAFLSAKVYRSPRVVWIMTEAEGVVTDLFARYRDHVDALPPEWRDQAPSPGSEAYARHVCDFIAGMTDRYALSEHRRLFDATPDLR